MTPKTKTPTQHGEGFCEKVIHRDDGYLHSGNDDSPYDVDGVSYCGRCHGWLDVLPDREVSR